MLTPVFVAGLGRSGTTAMMSLLATDSRVAVDRVYPFENRYFTYLAKIALLIDRQDSRSPRSQINLHDFEYSVFDGPPWDSRPAFPADNTRLLGFPSRDEILPNLWGLFNTRAAEVAPDAEFYAEKAPSWVPSMAREYFHAFTIFLFRDLRDVYISANAFMRMNKEHSFGRSRGDTDLDHARSLTHAFLNYFENYFMDRPREDCMLVRYEDMVLHPEHLPERLEHCLSLKVRWSDALSWPEKHRTAADTAQSVNRWRREPLPAEVAGFFARHLHSEMTHLGYSIPAGSKDSLLRFEFRRGAAGVAQLAHSGDGRLDLKKDHAAVSVTGPDFWIELPLEPFDAASVREIWVSLKGGVGEVCSLYWLAEAGSFCEERCSHIDYWPGPQWQVIRFDLSRYPMWKGRIAGLRLDIFNAADPETTGTGAIRWLRAVE